jgi:hypothetical protein
MIDTPAKRARNGFFIVAGVSAIAVFALLVGRALGLSHTLFTGFLGALVPGALGLLFFLNEPLSQSAFARSPRVDLVVSGMLLAASAIQAMQTVRMEPASPTLVIRGRTVTSEAIGFRLELPASWEVVPAPLPGLVSVRDSESDSVLSAMALVATNPGGTLDELLTEVLDSQRNNLHALSPSTSGRLGHLPARVVVVGGEVDDTRTMRASVAREGPYAIMVYCTVPTRATLDFAACDHLLEGSLSVR